MSANDLRILDRLLDPVRDCFTPEVASRISRLRADAAVQHRLEALAIKNAEGVISPDERAEYESLVSVGNLVAILQAKARAVVAVG